MLLIFKLQVKLLKSLKKLESYKEINCIALTGGANFFFTWRRYKRIKNTSSKSAKLKGLFNNFDQISKVKIPIVSLVEGHALGGGLEFCLMSDFIIASSEAKFGQPEINLGLIPGIGGTLRLKKYIGKSNASYLCMSGEIISSMQAYEFGMVSRVISKDKFKEESIKIAKKISEKPKSSLVEIKKINEFRQENLFRY